MSGIDKNEYDEIRSQLKEIKSVMDVSSSEFRFIYAADNFRRFFVLAGIFSLVLPFIYQTLLWVYGGVQSVPGFVLWLFYALIVLCWCVMIFIRTKTSISEAKRLGVKTGFFTIVKNVLSTKMMIALIPLVVFFILLPVKYPDAIAPSGYIPYAGIAAGLILNIIGVMIHEKEYFIGGMWIFLSAAILFFLASFSGQVSFAIIFAPGCFLFAAVNKYKVKRHEGG